MPCRVLLKLATTLILCLLLAHSTNGILEHKIGGRLKKLNTVLNDLVQLMNKSSFEYLQASTPKKVEDFLPADCDEARRNGNIKSGLYLIKLDGNHSVNVWCNMEIINGWTVIQRRFDRSVDFDRSWEEYRNGFGNMDGDFWLGLENIHSLTRKPRKLRISLLPSRNYRYSYFSWYSKFRVGDESSKYKLEISEFSGGFDIGFTNNNNCSFTSTKYGPLTGWWEQCRYPSSCNLNSMGNQKGYYYLEQICECEDVRYKKFTVENTIMEIL